jgi:hypothetical protein
MGGGRSKQVDWGAIERAAEEAETCSRKSC